MQNELDLNLNNAQCLREKTDFLNTVVYNVCNGEVYTVPHGSLDFVAMAGAGVIILLVAIMFLKLLADPY